MKLYTKNNIKNCRERVFGKTSFFKSYKLRCYYINEDNNLVETTDLTKDKLQFRIIGNERIKKDKLYMSVNEYTLFEDVKRIGKKMFDTLFTEIQPLIIYHDNYICINKTVVDEKIIKKHYKFILECIMPFLKNYGFPIDYISFSNETEKIDNDIDLADLCNYFLLLHIISDLGGHYNKGTKIEKCYEVLSISSKIEKNKLVAELLNQDFLLRSHLERFQIIYDELNPINCTHNLFSFAFERLKMNIIQKNGNYEYITRTTNVGIPITQENKNGKNARMIERKVPIDPEARKLYDANKQKKSYDEKINEYKRMIKMGSYIDKYDIEEKYKDLLTEVSNIKYQSRYKRKEHYNLYKSILEAYKILKKKNDRN